MERAGRRGKKSVRSRSMPEHDTDHAACTTRRCQKTGERNTREEHGRGIQLCIDRMHVSVDGPCLSALARLRRSCDVKMVADRRHDCVLPRHVPPPPPGDAPQWIPLAFQAVILQGLRGTESSPDATTVRQMIFCPQCILPQFGDAHMQYIRDFCHF